MHLTVPLVGVTGRDSEAAPRASFCSPRSWTLGVSLALLKGSFWSGRISHSLLPEVLPLSPLTQGMVKMNPFLRLRVWEPSPGAARSGLRTLHRVLGPPVQGCSAGHNVRWGCPEVMVGVREGGQKWFHFPLPPLPAVPTQVESHGPGGYTSGVRLLIWYFFPGKSESFSKGLHCTSISGGMLCLCSK